MILTNAKIYTMGSLGYIEKGFVKIDGTKIKKVGKMDDLKDLDDHIIDMHGKILYPGFIDTHTHLGMVEDSLTFEGDDINEASEPITPNLRAIDAINPMDRCFKEAINAGVTAVITGPGSSNPIAGQMVAIKTYGSRVDNMVIKDPVSIKFSLGENPKNTFNEKSQTPITRMAVAGLIREQLSKAKRYLEEKEAFIQDNGSKPEFDSKNEALLPLLKREIPGHFHAHRADDIFTAIRISKEFDIDYVIIHCSEGHLIADELKKENTKVFSGPFLSDRSKPELKNLTPKTPGVLAKNGIKTSIVTDHPVIPIQYLPVCASLAVREGMDPLEALKAITINAAELAGVDDRLGSIEENKDADILIFDNDALDFKSKPVMIFIDGKRIK